MKWLRGIGQEMKIMFKLTFVDPIRAGKMNDPGWMRDPHLRTGFLLALPIFMIPALLFFFRQIAIWWVPLAAILSNVVGLSYAAASRARRLPAQPSVDGAEPSE